MIKREENKNKNKNRLLANCRVEFCTIHEQYMMDKTSRHRIKTTWEMSKISMIVESCLAEGSLCSCNS